MKVNVEEANFELIELFGEKMLFTDLRIDRTTVPGNLFAYDLRHSDEGIDACEIANRILVNHLGTFLSSKEIKLERPISSYKPYKLIDAENDMDYLGERMTVKEYRDKYSKEEVIDGV